MAESRDGGGDAAGGAGAPRARSPYELAFALHPTPMWVVDRESLRILAVNDAATARYGWARGEGLARALLDGAPPVAARPPVDRRGEGAPSEVVVHDVDWEGRSAWLVLAPDATERERGAAALRAVEARLAGLLDSTMDAVISVDEQQRVTAFNRAAERIFGVTAAEAVGAPLDRFVPARFRAHHAYDVERFGRTGATARTMGHPGAVVALRADGTEFPAEATIWSAELPGEDGRRERVHTVVLRDVTVREQLATQLRQARRMEAVGRLAGGVAHDFNNLLTAIQGNADFVLAALAAGSQAREDVEEIRRAADRAAGLTRQLLAFGRQHALRPRLVALDDVVEGMARLLRRVIGADVRLETHCAAQPGRVLADPGQLEQVLLSLVLDARDAMPDGGTIVVRTATAAVDALPAAVAPPDAEPHGVVLLTVADTDAAVAAGTPARAGLAAVHAIVEQAGGVVWCERAPGRGTTVSIALPARAAVPDDVADARPDDGPGAPAVPLGTVLLVEDEAAVRGLAERMLQSAGYRVVTAANGREGLARWVEERGRGGGVDLIVSDLVMPDAGGRALVQRVREERPDVPVLFVSGYVEGGLAASHVGGRTAFLEKPFRRDALLAHVRALLGRG